MAHKFILTRMGQDTVGADSAIELIEKFPYQKIRDWGRDGYMLSFEKEDGGVEIVSISMNDMAFNYNSDDINSLAEAYLIITAFKSIDFNNHCIDMELQDKLCNKIIEAFHAYADAVSKNMALVAKYSISITSQFMNDAERDFKACSNYHFIYNHFKHNYYAIKKIRYNGGEN